MIKSDSLAVNLGWKHELQETEDPQAGIHWHRRYVSTYMDDEEVEETRDDGN